MARSAELKIVEIPEHVKQQAMDAVSHKETTAMIRAFQGSGSEVSQGWVFTHEKPVPENVQPLTDDVKRQAMDAVSHPETRAQIQLVKDSGEATPQWTPSRETERIAGKIAQMHQSGKDLDSTQRDMTKDNFGRDYG